MTAPVRAVVRAHAVLRVVVTSPNGASLARIAKVTRLPKSSVARMLDTLQYLEMVEQITQRGRYRVGPGLEVLAGGGASTQVLGQLSRPHLQTLVSQLREDATLSVPEGNKVLCINQFTADRTVDRIHLPTSHRRARAGLPLDMEFGEATELSPAGFGAPHPQHPGRLPGDDGPAGDRPSGWICLDLPGVRR